MVGNTRDAALAFLDAAFQSLAKAKVLPRSRYDAWPDVGTDYEGSLVMGLPEYEALESALREEFPLRFPIGTIHTEFPSSYMFGLLRAAIAYATRSEEPYTAGSASVQGAVDEALDLMARPDTQLRAIWICIGVAVVGGPHSLGDVELRPITDSVLQDVHDLIPGSARKVDAIRPLSDPGTTALIVLTRPATGKALDQWGGSDHAVSLLVTALRLLSNATLFVAGTVTGQPGAVSAHGTFARPGSGSGWIGHGERVLTVDGATFSAAIALMNVLKDLEAAGSGTSPVLIAIDRYTGSLTASSWRDAIVDVSVGLEAALGDAGENESILLRLRLRAAELLSTPGDPFARIWDDVGHLYGLRSKILHGTTFKPSVVEKTAEKVSGGSLSSWPGEKLTLAIDRWRDLLRRAILARLALGTAPDELWSWARQPPVVEREVGDAAGKAKWTGRITERLGPLGRDPMLPVPSLEGLFGMKPQQEPGKVADERRFAEIIGDYLERQAVSESVGRWRNLADPKGTGSSVRELARQAAERIAREKALTAQRQAEARARRLAA